MKIASEGLIFFLPPLGMGILFLLCSLFLPGFLFLILALFIIFFFRDPDRKIPQNENLILSPADGKIVLIGSSPEEEKAKGRNQMVSIFLSLFDVHVNRAPMKGTIVKHEYVPGKFLPAYKKAASNVNEMNIVEIKNGKNTIRLHQIAGVLARRVVLWKKTGDGIALGERLGIMKFGSRIDLFLPDNVLIKVKQGERVKAGISIIGVLK
jgi:phosphatidylserine decarboxylase